MLTAATFDLECTSLNADFGIILCAVIKAHDSRAKPKILRADSYKQWDKRRSDDSALVQDIAEELKKYDVLVAHNGHRFDIPFLRTRMARHGMEPFPKKKLIDPVVLARNNLKMSFNGLERLADFLGCNTKSQVSGDLWLRASLDGDKKAMNYIVEHCVQDVLMLDNVLDAVKHYSTAINSWGSGF